MEAEQEYYEGDFGLPIFQRIPPGLKRLFTVEQIIRILMNPLLKNSGRICTAQPTSICENVSFIVDVTQLDHPDDLLSDDMGVWRNNRVDTTYFTARIDEAGVHSVEKFSEPSSRRYKLVRVYRNHGTNPSLKKTTACIRGKLGNWQVSVPFPMFCGKAASLAFGSKDVIIICNSSFVHVAANSIPLHSLKIPLLILSL